MFRYIAKLFLLIHHHKWLQELPSGCLVLWSWVISSVDSNPFWSRMLSTLHDSTVTEVADKLGDWEVATTGNKILGKVDSLTIISVLRSAQENQIICWQDFRGSSDVLKTR